MTLKKYVIPSLPGKQEDDLSIVVDKYNTALRLLAQAIKSLRDEYASGKNRTTGSSIVSTGSGGSGGGGGSSTSKDHHTLNNLNAFDDHARYLHLDGRLGSQTAIGGIAASEDLVFQSTAHATRGRVRSVDDMGVPEDKKIIYDVE